MKEQNNPKLDYYRPPINPYVKVYVAQLALTPRETPKPPLPVDKRY